MAKFRIGDVVSVNQDTIDIRGVIRKIEKGSYNKETKEYVLDTYHVVVGSGANESFIDCNKHNLTLIERSTSNEIKKLLSYGKKKDDNRSFFYTKHQNVFVLGIRYEEKEEVVKEIPTTKKLRGEEIQGTFVTIFNKPLRRFVIGYAICNAEDEFNMDKAFEIAERRAMKRPAGELRSNNWTMLQDDQCELLVRCEAEHIAKNITKYTTKKKKVKKSKKRKNKKVSE